MEQRRFLFFISLSLLFWMIWINFVLPKVAPPKPKPQENVAELDDVETPPADALHPRNVAEKTPEVEAPPKQAGIPEHPKQLVTLGSLDPNSNVFMSVELTSLGASVQTIVLNGFPEFGNRDKPLKVVGSDLQQTHLRTFETPIPALDQQLPPGGNQNLHWELLAETKTSTVAEFRLVSPNGQLEVVKKYELRKPTKEQLEQPKARDLVFQGYELLLTVTLKNRSTEEKTLEYSLQGPVGLPLEDPDNSSKYRDLRMGYLSGDGRIDHGKMTAAEVVDKEAAALKDNDPGKLQLRTGPLKYIGVDVKYFAALVEPLGNQVEAPTVVASRAQLVKEGTEKQYSDISVVLNAEAKLRPLGSADDRVEHQYLLFTGPKRQELLAGIGAESIMDFGYSNAIASLMLSLLNLFHRLGASYGVAIILLTVLVRGLMFPISRHQAHNMQRMKELQPKIKEIQQKHAGNKEELGRATMELYRKHNFNPLSGCLPLLLQLPIFIGLYTALSGSVDLRMTPFLWFQNLASPDALFPLGFKMPFFGWTTFNLLPVLSAGLMFFQQKMMMPPPADEEQAMQQKMMNYMSVVMGAMFYRVPSGLCLYFIVSSGWGMVERFLLNKLQKSTSATPAPTVANKESTTPDPESSSSTASRIGDLWNKLQSAADKDVSITRSSGDSNGKKKKR